MDSIAEQKRIIIRKYKNEPRITYDYYQGELYYAEKVKTWVSLGPVAFLTTKKELITRASNMFFVPKMLKLDRFGRTRSLFLEAVDKAERDAAEAEREWMHEVTAELSHAYGQHFSNSNPTGLKR